MKLITELNESVEYITEAKEDGSKNHYIHGIFMQAEVPNRNGRIYPLHVMESAVNSYVNTCINGNRAYGELGHPTGPQINLDRVSHMIVELVRDGFNFIGKAKLTETPMGEIAKGLLKSGASLGVSSRGLGTLKPDSNGIMQVQNDFQLATAADIVADPSAPNAFVNGIMEGAEWVFDISSESWHQEKIHELKKSLKRMKMDEIEESKFSVYNNFIKLISSKS